MKEIDFLPEWYKSGRRRQISYRTQYVALGGIFVVMLVWSFIADRSVSKAKAELAQTTARASFAESGSQEFAKIKDQVTELQKKANILGKIDSKIDVAGVLAEVSFLIDESVVLGRVELGAETFAGRQEGKTFQRAGAAVRVAGRSFAGKEMRSLGDVRFKVVISGIAADASDVAELICKLEDSPYFCLVYPSFSRNKKIQVETGLGKENFRVTEFEIGCYLANYREQVRK